MTYIRSGWEMKYVEGESKDYVFPAGEYGEFIIEDYGGISNEGLCEILCRIIDRHFDIYMGTDIKRFNPQVEKEYFMKQLAQKLNVKLRGKPLTDDEILERMERKVSK